MSKKISTFLMFEGRAEEAMNFYISLFPDGKIESIDRYGSEGPGLEGSVKKAAFSLAGETFLCIDSPVAHGFSFTPSISLFVDCESEPEIDRLFAALSKNGTVLMPLEAYPFARRFGWINDRFGASWQFNLA